MELTRLPEIPYVDARRMAEAGTATVAALAAMQDVSTLAQRAGLPEETVEGYRHAARAHVERLLAGAGIQHEADLVAAHPEELAAKTGLPVAEVKQFQDAARASLARQEEAHPSTVATDEPIHVAAAPSVAIEPAPEAHPALHEPEMARNVAVQATDAGPERVVLVDGVATARLVVASRVLESVPIVTGRFEQDATDALARAGPTAVFLTPGAVTAIIRVEGGEPGNLPIYKARPEGGEMRVRVKEIRERKPGQTQVPVQGPAPTNAETPPAPAKKGFFSRLLKR